MQVKKKEIIDRLLESIDKLNRKFDRSPTVHELAKDVGIAVGSVSNYLHYMDEQELITYIPRRKIEVIHREFERFDNIRLKYIPLFSAIACGGPTAADSEPEGYIPFPEELLDYDDCFCIRCRGDSMIDAHIYDGDIVVVKPAYAAEIGDIVAAITPDGETTLKRLAWDEDRDCYYLKPENDDYDRMYGEFYIQGVAIKLITDVV